MSINGVLEDLPLADVLQFVHLGRRTGTLYLWLDEERRAEIGFHDGKIVSAWTPHQRKLGDLLVAAEVIDQEALPPLLSDPRIRRRTHTLGQLLIESGKVKREDIHAVVREQVKTTLFELVTWRRGNFHFEIDELNPADEFALAPGELLGDLDLNTQMLLLEAAQLLDEQRRGSAPLGVGSNVERRLRQSGFAAGETPSAAPAPVPRPVAVRPRRKGPSAADGSSGAFEALRCQVISDDGEILTLLRSHLPIELVRALPVRLREAGNRFPGESESPIVVMDLRRPELDFGSLAHVARTRPSAPLIAVVEKPEDLAPARKAGALSAVCGGDDSLVDCVRNLIRVFNHPSPQGTFGFAAKGGLSKFRRVVFDVQSGLLSATMALNLMHVISESVERALLFLVQNQELVVCGAFGFSINGQPLAQITRNLRWRMEPDSAAQRALDQGEPLSLPYTAVGLPVEMAARMGRPAHEQVVLFPVLGAERAISLIYTDNGHLDQPIQDIRILELATSQVGVAFENELLRRHLGNERLPPDDSFL